MEDKNDKEIQFLFDIVSEVKYFYEFPVVFVTKKDLGDDVFNIFCKLRRLKLDNSSKEDIMDTIAEYNIQWLQGVVEVQKFKTDVKSCSNDEIYKVINFSINALDNRFKYLKRYIYNYKHFLKGETARKMDYEIEIIQDMHTEVKGLLHDKLLWAKNLATESELKCQMEDEACNLLSWFDKINDKLSVLTAKHFQSENIIDMALELLQPLREITRDLKNDDDFMREINSNYINFDDLVRSPGGCPREARVIANIVSDLSIPIKQLSHPSATGAQALVDKKILMENKLDNLNNTTLAKIYQQLEDEGYDECICYESRIFNHLLPISQREKLVTELCYIWDKVFSSPKDRKSIISIMSAASVQEEFEDDLGKFHVDNHGRKIYQTPGSPTLYQQNEENELVPLNDDDCYVFFYDECGRYYLDKKTQERIYKAHTNASEYLLGPSGRLVKHKEERYGVTFYYDVYGRYYINQDGKKIYRESDSTSEYEQDGYGNLVRIHSRLNILDPCVDDAQVSEDSAYLKKTVGSALRECLASVVLHQPADPIKYLSVQLRIYKDNMILKEEMRKNNNELLAERNMRALEERAAAERAAALKHLEDIVSEASELDSNLAQYEPLHGNNESD